MKNLWLKNKIWRLGMGWFGGRRWYQYIEFSSKINTKNSVKERGIIRTNNFLKFIDNYEFLSEDRILDIGSNAGLFCLKVSEKVTDVIGVELDSAFHKQAIFVKKYFTNENKKYDNVKLMNLDLTNNLEIIDDRTLIFASKVLYHKNLGDKLYDLMERIQKSQVHTIIMQGHTTQGEIGQNKGMKNLMKEYGFFFETVIEHYEYPVAIAKRIKS
jgi:hypothetical protein